MQAVNLDIKGLYLNGSPLNPGKSGYLAKAVNVNIDEPNTITPRRGFKAYGDVLVGTATAVNLMDVFENKMLLLSSEDVYFDSDGSGTWSIKDISASLPDAKIGFRSFKINESFYYNDNNGIQKLETITGQFADAGVPKAISFSGALSGTSGFFTADKQIAYRVVWGITDSHDYVHLGTPSERIELVNALGNTSKDVDLTIYIPAGITTSHFYQIYRSGLSANDDTIANDELQLVYEDFPTAAEITAKVISVTDITPDSLRGATIYTADTQEGLAQANDIPPAAKDITTYKNYALYANTRTKQRKYLSLTAVSGTNGVDVTDVITINSVDYTGAYAQDHTAGEFKVWTSGTASENVRDTALSLVNVINRYASNTDLYAYYMSGYDELPGKILLERRDLTDTSFAITFTTNTTGMDHSVAWNPTLPTSGTTISSDNEDKGNRIYISKIKEPEAVPLLNFIDVGSSSSEILRVVPLRDSVFIFKDDGEIWRLTGEDIDSFDVNLFDNTVKLIAPKTAVTLNNAVWCLTSQGVVAVSDTGVEIKSWDITRRMKVLYKSANPNLTYIRTYGGTYNIGGGYNYEIIYPITTTAWAVAHQSENRYILSDGVKFWVYNILTNAWTNWDRTDSCGFVNSYDNLLYLGGGTVVFQERKSGKNRWDFADREWVVSIVANSSTTVTLGGEAAAAVGYYLRVTNSNVARRITAVNGNVVTVSKRGESFSLSAPSATLYEPIKCQFEFLPIHCGNPSIMKHFREITTFFENIFNMDALTTDNEIDDHSPESILYTMYFTNNVNLTIGNYVRQSIDIVPITDRFTTSFITQTQNRTYIPDSMNKCLWLNLEYEIERCFIDFKFNGAILSYEPMDTQFTEAG